MSDYYNEFYGYPDIELWDDLPWKDRGPAGQPLIDAIVSHANPDMIPDYYADRNDLTTDRTNRCAYFSDVIDSWKAQGMEFTCAGMMGLTMVPKSVIDQTDLNPTVLFVPFCADRENDRFAMNVLRHFEALLKKAAEENVLVQFLPCDFMHFTELGLETQGTFRISYEPVYLDISILKQDGISLDSIPGVFVSDYPKEEIIAGVPAVDFTKKWQENRAHQVTISRIYQRNVPAWNYEKQVHSMTGRLQAESFHLEYDYRDPHEKALLSFWDKKGLLYEDHIYDGEWWVTLAPKSITTKPDVRLPLLIIMKEPRTAVPQMMLTAYQFYADFLDIAANGECIALFFALETPDDNDMLADIIAEAQKSYPMIDPERIYLTGQSHNGYYALEFYRRHPGLIAAAATLNDPIGLELGARVDYYDDDPDAIDRSFAQHDMPLINFNGQLENQYPVVSEGSERERELAEYFRRRLVAFRCPERSLNEIMQAKKNGDFVTRKNGIPADRTEVQYIFGAECYISDVRNVDGNWHLRFVTQENLPHMISPQMAQLSWSFLRRFARDRMTGETIELY